MSCCVSCRFLFNVNPHGAFSLALPRRPRSAFYSHSRSRYPRVIFVRVRASDQEAFEPLSFLLSELRKLGVTSGYIATARGEEMAVRSIPVIGEAEVRCSGYPPS